MATSAAANELFALPSTHNALSGTDGPGARRRRRQARKDELTARLGSAAANTQLQQEADDDAAKVVAAVTPKIEQMSTENQLLATTIKQLKSVGTPPPTTTSPLASSLITAAISPNPATGPRATALGEARAAEYYTSTAQALEGFATFWGPLLIIALGIGALFWNWYHRHPLWQLVLTITVLAIASFFPVYVMQLPRAAISPLMKLV